MDELTPEFVARYAEATEEEQRALSMQMTFGQRFRIGPMLFEYVCGLWERGLRVWYPHYTDEEIKVRLHLMIESERQHDEYDDGGSGRAP